MYRQGRHFLTPLAFEIQLFQSCVHSQRRSEDRHSACAEDAVCEACGEEGGGGGLGFEKGLCATRWVKGLQLMSRPSYPENAGCERGVSG